MAKLEPRTVGRVPLLQGMHRWTEQTEVVIAAVPGDETPTMLLWDGAEGAWRAIVLPDGSRWRVLLDRAGLWTPGRPT